MGRKLTAARYVPLCCYLFALTAALAACLLVSVVYPTGSITGTVNSTCMPHSTGRTLEGHGKDKGRTREGHGKGTGRALEGHGKGIGCSPL